MSTVMITGASSGIGRDLALLYAKHGHQVIACGRNQQRLDHLAAEHSGISTLAFDMTDKTSIGAATSKIKDVDTLVLNAGDCEYIDNPTEFDADLFERVIQTNLIATGYLLQALIPKISPGGRIAFVSSSVTYLPFPRAEAYGASKAGMDYLASSLALDLKPYRINISLIRPGFVKTPLTDKNDFNMPFLMSTENSAKIIYTGLQKGKKTIEFPGRFIFFLKLFNRLPDALWARLIARKAS